MPDTPTDRLASFVADLRLAAIPSATVQHTTTVVRDTLGTLLAGMAQPENAALAASAAVTLELDEGNQFAVNHPSVHPLPATLAVAEAEGASGGCPTSGPPGWR